MGRANVKKLAERWREAGLEAGSSSGTVDVSRQSPEDKLLGAAVTVTIGNERQMTRWRIENAASNTYMTCPQRWCDDSIYPRSDTSILTDRTGERPDPVVVHARCQDAMLEQLGGQQSLKVQYPHEVGFGESVEEILGTDGRKSDIDGFSGDSLTKKPLGRNAYVANISDAMLQKLRAVHPDLDGFGQEKE